MEFVAKPTDGRRSAHKPKEETKRGERGWDGMGRKKKKKKPRYYAKNPPAPYFRSVGSEMDSVSG